jgi:hypothetical protein
MPALGDKHMLDLGESQVLISREGQGSDLGKSQMPHEGDFAMLGLAQSPPDSPQDMHSKEDQQPPPGEGVGEEHADDPAHTD